jgi:hypothetical protein
MAVMLLFYIINWCCSHLTGLCICNVTADCIKLEGDFVPWTSTMDKLKAVGNHSLQFVQR